MTPERMRLTTPVGGRRTGRGAVFLGRRRCEEGLRRAEGDGRRTGRGARGVRNRNQVAAHPPARGQRRTGQGDNPSDPGRRSPPLWNWAPGQEAALRNSQDRDTGGGTAERALPAPASNWA